MSDFYDAGALGQIAINLFHGYGYNFYREENQLRADDQKIRTLVCELLARARKAVSEAESAFRHGKIPAPTRGNPFPPTAVLADAKRLETLSTAIGSIEGQVRHAPVPGNDRMTQRYREEGGALLALIEKDKLLVGQAETLRSMVSNKTSDEMLFLFTEIEGGIAAIGQTLAGRGMLIL